MAKNNKQRMLPVMYRELRPLSSDDYGSWLLQRTGAYPNAANVHAVPITLDEFPEVHRRMPIVFGAGKTPMPMALMALNEGLNVFLDENGTPHDPDLYIPSFIRRYPFILAATGEKDRLSLCVDPTSEEVGDLSIGDPLFVDGEPSETTQQLLRACEQYERRVRTTTAFVGALQSLELLTESTLSITIAEGDEPISYSGFLSIDEEKLRELPEAKVMELHKGSGLTFIHAHLLSMGLIKTLFATQIAQGWDPTPKA
jgi:hypothetical protein